MASATSQPYVLAAIISAVPATLAATSAWYSAHRGRKESQDGDANIAAEIGTLKLNDAKLDARFERIETHFERIDLRFDGIEDKVERHLGWHRAEAEGDLPTTFTKESILDQRPRTVGND